ncbi:phosphotransferase [Streptomyces sp. NPDC052682]|uniref:phosphotransferase n=1 Tax=Streptomyces sp. NPDC052682 TaxID=3154954 RepID=UPI00342DDF5E
MSSEPASSARRHALQVCGDASVVEGPLQGYHHETYVFPLPGGAGTARPVRWKCREPRTELLWFDRRCFASEEELLDALSGRITGIPDILEFGGLRLQRFIEGRTLGSLWESGLPVPEPLLRQIAQVFRQLAEVTAETLIVKRRCTGEDRPEDGDTDGFLERLVCFTEENVYLRNLQRFEALFGELGVDGDSFKKLRKQVPGLRERPFCLLHADLHRENFIVDRRGRLWTIDWELAMLGDPLYDLATHLHLMRYPTWQARRLTEQWCRTVEKVRRGSSNGWEQDLGRLLSYKKAQSVFTDVIRVALSLEPGQGEHGRHLARSALRLRGVLAEAAVPLGLDRVPDPREITAALARWCRTHGEPRRDLPG